MADIGSMKGGIRTPFLTSYCSGKFPVEDRRSPKGLNDEQKGNSMCMQWCGPNKGFGFDFCPKNRIRCFIPRREIFF